MKAYDLWFENGTGIGQHPLLEATQPLPSDAPVGWIGSAGAAVDPRTWPRGPLTGLPMFHALTLLLPPDYRRRGPDLPAVGFFQGEGQFAHPRADADPAAGPLDVEDPFEVDLGRAVDHPQLQRRTDIIDGRFALLWLTHEEYSRGPVAPPPDTRRPGEHVADDQGPNAWDTVTPTRSVWLLERDDPNVGRVPVDPVAADGTPGWTNPYTADFSDRAPWAKRLGWYHLGGTAMPVQSLPEGLTPFFLEIDELPGLNFGGGSAQIDLESDTFDWACG
ncbi:hypothetical protein ACFUMH_07970 [Cellulomonas sp. NPDC057328]|uniref:hypothetical protein n=1 Tax=Cellulomonas sp. NPDC057328 TaxID=3346101 RepID=UPI00363B40FB